MIERNECSMSEVNIMHWTFIRVGQTVAACITLSDFGTDEPDVLLVSDEPIVTDHVLFWNCSSWERCQIIVITITNNNFRLRYVSSKLDQVLLLLLLTNKL
jgi:hypothetical protein